MKSPQPTAKTPLVAAPSISSSYAVLSDMDTENCTVILHLCLRLDENRREICKGSKRIGGDDVARRQGVGWGWGGVRATGP